VGNKEGKVRKGYHCAWEIHYHIVFPVKYRKALLYKEVVEVIKGVAMGIEERYAIEFEALGMDRGHIHILCSAHPKVSPGQIVRVFKSITARDIFRKVPEVKKELWGGEFWTEGYYVGTVGEGVTWEVVEEYVRRQGRPTEGLRQLDLFKKFIKKIPRALATG